MTTNPNLAPRTVARFGDQLQRCGQQGIAPGEVERMFADYSVIFPWDQRPHEAERLGMGCGSCRWASFVAPRVGRLHCIGPSSDLAVARQALAYKPKCSSTRLWWPAAVCRFVREDPRPAPITRLWQQHPSGRYDLTTKLWSVLMSHAWLEQWG